MTLALPAVLAAFLRDHAASLDEEAAQAGRVLPLLGEAGVLRVGVPVAAGGAGGSTADGIDLIAAVAQQSLAAAFVFWAQRAFVEYLLASDNAALRERLIAPLLAGDLAGATGLSNAMKFLSGIENLQIRAAAQPDGHRLDGQVPWATNVPAAGFVVAVAVARDGGGTPFVAALPSGRAGVTRGPDLDLIALRGSNTATLRLAAVPVAAGDLLAEDARAWLPRARPAFLGLQCGLSVGLARAALAAAQAAAGPAAAVLAGPLAAAAGELDEAVRLLRDGLADGRYAAQPAPLFELRIRLAELALHAVGLELQASGGRAYHRDAPSGFARRWREAAFLPIVTPSILQLRGELEKHKAAQAPRQGAAA